MYFRFTTDEQLEKMLETSKKEMYWHEMMMLDTKGQPYAHYYKEYQKEKERHDAIEAEMLRRGLVQ
jgi:hypothetical protein